MLSKTRRIPRQYFPEILTKGRRYNSPSLLLYCLPTAGESRFSFSVSKKVCKKAVDRNKHRRRGYAAVQKHLDSIKSGFFCFLSFKKGSGGISFAALEKEITDLLKASSVVR